MNGKNKTLLCASSLVTAACGRAPAIDIEGSFFPIWMICLTTAFVVTFAVRYLLVRARIESHVGPVALFYPCLIILCTSLMWLIFFR
jgi:hypothetical protein